MKCVGAVPTGVADANIEFIYKTMLDRDRGVHSIARARVIGQSIQLILERLRQTLRNRYTDFDFCYKQFGSIRYKSLG